MEKRYRRQEVVGQLANAVGLVGLGVLGVAGKLAESPGGVITAMAALVSVGFVGLGTLMLDKIKVARNQAANRTDDDEANKLIDNRRNFTHFVGAGILMSEAAALFGSNLFLLAAIGVSALAATYNAIRAYGRTQKIPLSQN